METITASSPSSLSVSQARPSNPFAAVREHCREDLDAVDHEIATVLKGEAALLNEVGDYLAASEGKKLRPVLTVLSARACGGRGTSMHKVAASMELVHTATLLHDDVIDKSSLRRGQPTINARFGDDIAILMADYLYSNAFELSLHALKPEILQMVCKVTSRMCEGELFQIEKRDALLTEYDYYKIIKAKTAYLFSACCGLGGVVSGARKARVEALGEFGLEFGLAFQVTDDILDYEADQKVFGKTIGTDITSGKQTLPFLRALAAASAADRPKLIEAIKAGDVPVVLELVTKHGGLESARRSASEHVRKALEALDRVGRGPEIELLRAIALHVVNRSH